MSSTPTSTTNLTLNVMFSPPAHPKDERVISSSDNFGSNTVPLGLLQECVKMNIQSSSSRPISLIVNNETKGVQSRGRGRPRKSEAASSVPVKPSVLKGKERFVSITNTKLFRFDEAKNITIVNEEKIRPINNILDAKLPGVIGLITPQGLGKTVANNVQLAIQYAEGGAFVGRPFISISNRITLDEKQQADYAEAGLHVVSYRDIKDGKYRKIDMGKYPMLSICINSLYRLADANTDGCILVMDEIESILSQIAQDENISRGPGGKSSIYKVLDRIIASAHQVWITDANLKESTLACFYRLYPNKDIHIYKNMYTPNVRTVHFAPKFHDLMNYMFRAIRSGQKVFFPTNSDAKAQLAMKEIKERFPKLKVGLFNSEYEIERGGVDPIQALDEFDVAIVTPKFIAGNSFVKKHFDVTFAYFSAASCGAEGCSQMLTRVRNISSGELYITIDCRQGANNPIRSVKSLQDMRDYVVKKANIIRDKHMFLGYLGEITNIVTPKHPGILNLSKPEVMFPLATAYETNIGFLDFEGTLYSIMKNMMGYIAAHETIPLLEEEIIMTEEGVKKKSKEVKDEIAVDKAQNILFAYNLEEEEAINLISRPIGTAITQEQKNSLQKRSLFEEVKIKPELLKPAFDEFSAVAVTLPETESVDVSKIEFSIEAQKSLHVISLAQKIRRPKRMLNRMLKLACPPNMEIEREEYEDVPTGLDDIEPKIVTVKSGLEYHEQEIFNMTSILYDISRLPIDASNKKAVEFDRQDDYIKGFKIMYLVSFLRAIGFNSAMFDPSLRIGMKPRLIDYIKDAGIDKIQEIFRHKFTDNQLDKTQPKYIIQWLNSHLESMWMITVDQVDKHGHDQTYYINSPWRIVEMQDGSFEVMHTIESMPESHNESTYKQTFQNLLIRLRSTFTITEAGSECYFEDNTHQGGYIITDIVRWFCLVEKMNDEGKTETIRSIVKGYYALKAYERILRTGKPVKKWPKFKKEYFDTWDLKNPVKEVELPHANLRLNITGGINKHSALS